MRKNIKNLKKKLKIYNPKLKEECGVFGISKAVKYSGLGKLDTVFGFFFGFLRGYIICVCIFSTVNIFYNYTNWPLNTKTSWTFPYVQKGSNYLIKEFPNEEKYKESKEKIEDI